MMKMSESDLIQFLKQLWTQNRAGILIILTLFVLRYLIIFLYKKRKGVKAKDNFVLGINNVTYISSTFVGFFIVLHLAGITISEFLSSITIFAAALAIVFKDYIANGLNGMILMFGDNLHLGDYIQVGMFKGRIDNFTLINMHLLNDDDDLVIIPNSLVINSEVINFSKNPKHHSSIDFEVQSAQSLDSGTLEKQLQKILEPEMELIKEGSAKLRVVEFKKDLVHYRFRFGLKNFDPQVETRLKQIIWREVLNLLNGQK